MLKLIKITSFFKIFTDLKFAIFILGIIAFFSSLGSFIEQDESIKFYEENYLINKPIYGFIDSNLILNFGLNHIYSTWYFLLLLLVLGICLVSCSFTRQFPLVLRSKEYIFKKKKNSFISLPFSIQFKNIYFFKELILNKLQKLNFYVYQTNNLIYGYKGLIGRISPILVHISLILILIGGALGAFKNFKAQEFLPKGELFHIQNTISIGKLTNIPTINTRVNDFWVEYDNNRIHQFYSNLSILDTFGNEVKTQTISVNNPLHYKNIDFYQSDWNLIGIRLENIQNHQIYEFPLFKLKGSGKSWITWINLNNESFSLIFNNLENTYLLYNDKGNFINLKNINDTINNQWKIIDIIPATGLLIKYDPSIPLIYFGFGLLMITSCLSYLPYTQIWIFSKKRNIWIGGITNRGKLQLEIEFENLIRFSENLLLKNKFIKKKS
jgi:cytochrome c biogenesis protein